MMKLIPQLIAQLISNIALIVTFTFLTAQIHKNRPVTLSSPLKHKSLLGVLNGCFGIVLMLFSVPVNQTTFIDLRQLFIVSSARFGGIYTAVLANTVMTAGRFLIAGGITKPAIVSSLTCYFIAIGCGYLVRRIRGSVKKWLSLTLLSLLSFTFVFPLLIRDHAHLVEIVVAYWIATLIGTFTLAYLADYLRKSNEAFRLLERQARTDFLTGLNNARQFERAYKASVLEARQKQGELSLLLLDIDFFKKINDTYGHAAGDAVLKEFSQILKPFSRPSDLIFRHGGEEFCLLLPDTPLEKASLIAEQIRSTVEKKLFLLPNGESVKITVSIGIASYPSAARAPEDLLEQADRSLYTAKNKGRNRVCIGES